MRTTLNLDQDLIAQAQEATGISEKTRLIHLGLELIVQRAAAHRLAALGGSDPQAAAAPRRKMSAVRTARSAGS